MLISFTRTVILFFLVSVTLRVMGKRQVGELEPAELVVTILLSELVAIPMQDLSVPLLASIVPTLTVLAVDILISHTMLKNIRLRTLVAGKPSILVHNGKLVKKQLSKNRITVNEIIESLRIKNITDIATVQYAILETNGLLSTLLYPEHRPPTQGELLGVKGGDGLPVIVISDGRLIDNNISYIGVSRAWVEAEAKARGARGIKDVFLMMVDEKKNIFFQTQHDAETEAV